MWAAINFFGFIFACRAGCTEEGKDCPQSPRARIVATPAFPAIETQPTAEVELAEVELGELRFDAAGRPVVGARGPRGPPAATSYAVMVPQGAMPGATRMTTTPGGLQVHVVVPQGAVPGSTFMVSA